jgi:LytS/YehU family sensor histidine kinase
MASTLQLVKEQLLKITTSQEELKTGISAIWSSQTELKKKTYARETAGPEPS